MDRVVLVTGASAGIGQACATRLHAAGWTVFGASRRGTAEGGWTPVVMDVDRDDSVREGFEEILETDRSARRGGGRCRLGPRRRGRADLDRGRPRPARDQLLGGGPGGRRGPCR